MFTPTHQHTRAAVISGEARTHTEAHQEDLVALRYMLAGLQRATTLADNTVTLPQTTYAVEPNGRQHRIVLLNNTVLREGGDFAYLGFFGQKRAVAGMQSLDALDAELIQDLSQYPPMLSYSSLELAGGDWGNLVVMSTPQVAVDWAGSARHAYAAYTVAPACYTSIRLHSGSLTLHASAASRLDIRHTKYVEYHDPAR